MGEYALYNGEQVKIGTCEEMYYLRADQAHKVQPLDGNVNPIRDATEIRFRFPWPDEDHIAPGAFERFERNVGLYDHVPVPSDVQHDSVQFKADAGYLISLPCPESPSASEYKFHRNGWSGAVKIAQQRLVGDKLVLICQCGGCGAKYRLSTLAEAQPVIDACLMYAKRERLPSGDESKAKWWEKIAERIRDGYEGPNFWK